MSSIEEKTESGKPSFFYTLMIGNTMAPDWLDGDEVHFRELCDNEDYQIDEDYFIKTADFSTIGKGSTARTNKRIQNRYKRIQLISV